MPETVIYNGTGRRKTSVARVWLRRGNGSITVNKKSVEDYFPREVWQIKAREPLSVTDTSMEYDVMVRVQGGGLTGQAGAVSHGLARALLKANESFRKKLKVSGLLKRDPRMVETKKYGKRKARRGQQFSKR